MKNDIKNETSENKQLQNFPQTNVYFDEVEDWDDTRELIEKNAISRYNEELKNIFSSLSDQDKARDDIESSKSFDEITERYKLDAEVIHSFTDTVKEDRKLKKGYAISLIIIFIVQLFVFHFIFILNGCGVLKFNDSTLNIYVGGSIIEVIALIKIIVQYLFKDNISQSIDSILDKNKIKKDKK